MKYIKGTLAWILYGFSCLVYPLYGMPLDWSCRLQGESDYGPWETTVPLDEKLNEPPDQDS